MHEIQVFTCIFLLLSLICNNSAILACTNTKFTTLMEKSIGYVLQQFYYKILQTSKVIVKIQVGCFFIAHPVDS